MGCGIPEEVQIFFFAFFLTLVSLLWETLPSNGLMLELQFFPSSLLYFHFWFALLLCEKALAFEINLVFFPHSFFLLHVDNRLHL